MVKKIIFIMLISIAVGYMIWQLGRWYGYNEVHLQQQSYLKQDTLLNDAYNFYMLKRCLNGELDLSK